MQCDRSCQPSSCVIRRPVNVFFRSRHTASLLVSRFNHTRTARLSGSEGRMPAHRPPLFACIDGHALARQTHICSSDRKHNCRIGHTQRNLDDGVFPVQASRLELSFHQGSGLCRVAPHFNGLATLVFTPTQFTAAFGRASLRDSVQASAPDTSQHHYSCNNKVPCMIIAARAREYS
jgi:hypothetical protein